MVAAPAALVVPVVAASALALPPVDRLTDSSLSASASMLVVVLTSPSFWVVAVHIEQPRVARTAQIVVPECSTRAPDYFHHDHFLAVVHFCLGVLDYDLGHCQVLPEVCQHYLPAVAWLPTPSAPVLAGPFSAPAGCYSSAFVHACL